MSSLDARSAIRRRLEAGDLLGFVVRDGRATRTVSAKIGGPEIILSGISTSFSLSPVSTGIYDLFTGAGVGLLSVPDGAQVTLTISISGLPAGTTLTDTATSTSGTLTSGTDVLTETVLDTSLQTSLQAIQLAFANGAIVPASVTVGITLQDTDSVYIVGLPNSNGVSFDSTGSTVATLLPCYAEGTLIRTASGETPVERLAVGDRVVSAFGGAAPVRWLGHRRVDCARHPRPREVWPVRVRADAFAPGQPRRDLMLSPDHAVFADGHLIPIRYLLNGATIAQERWPAVTYWHVELPAHDVIFAEHLPAETYLDTGNRGAFAEAEGPVHLAPDFARAVWDAQGCATLVASGPVVETARARLWRRAQALGHRRSHDPRLTVLADGRLLPPEPIPGGVRVRVPANTRAAHLLSRSMVPEQEGYGADHRALGVAVAALRFADAPLALDDPRLGAGWHPAEAGLRWTDGAATISLAGGGRLEIALARIDLTYWDDAPALLAAA
jgi:Hint domain